MYIRIWSWASMPCEKHGPRVSVTKRTSAFGLGFCLLSPSGHVFHTTRHGRPWSNLTNTGASWCDIFRRLFESLCWLSMCRIPIPYPGTNIFYSIADTYMIRACFPSIFSGQLRTVSANERRYVCNAHGMRSFEKSLKWTFCPAAQNCILIFTHNISEQYHPYQIATIRWVDL